MAVLRHDLVNAEDSSVPVERVLHATFEMSCDTSEAGVEEVLRIQQSKAEGRL
jgi:hypothetical protein